MSLVTVQAASLAALIGIPGARGVGRVRPLALDFPNSTVGEVYIRNVEGPGALVAVLGAGVTFRFCDDKLYSLSRALGYGFPPFNRILERETARLGPGKYRVINDEVRNVFSIWWQVGDEIETLTLIEIQALNIDLGTTQSWDAEKTLCQPLKR